MSSRQTQVMQVVTTVAAIVAALAPVAIFFHGQRGEAVHIEAIILGNITLLALDLEPGEAMLKMFFLEKRINNISVILIKVTNTGRRPIKSGDMEEPITVLLDGVDVVISATVISSEPANLSIIATPTGSQVELSKSLLNPGDEVIVEIICVPRPDMRVTVREIVARIVGLGQIEVGTTRGEINQLLAEARTLTTSMRKFLVTQAALFLLIGGLINGILWKKRRSMKRRESEAIETEGQNCF